MPASLVVCSPAASSDRLAVAAGSPGADATVASQPLDVTGSGACGPAGVAMSTRWVARAARPKTSVPDGNCNGSSTIGTARDQTSEQSTASSASRLGGSTSNWPHQFKIRRASGCETAQEHAGETPKMVHRWLAACCPRPCRRIVRRRRRLVVAPEALPKTQNSPPNSSAAVVLRSGGPP